MKKTILALTGFLFFAIALNAQDDGPKLAKSAGKSLATYNMDRSGNVAKLSESKQKIDQAMETAEAQALVSAWLTKGDVYRTLIENDMALRMINPKTPLSGDNDALVAYDAYKKAFDMATKKYEKSDAVKGIAQVQGHMINIGVEKYQASAFEKAFLSFQGSIQAHEVLKANEQKSALDDPKQLDDIMFFTGKSAQLANRQADAVVYFEKLYQGGNAIADVYDGLYNGKIALGDQAAAEKYLNEGRKKYPDDPTLLFAEINQYLKAGKLDELITRLEQAIKQEPDNIGLYVTLGNVYDNLYQKMLKDKNLPKANEYFDSAKKNYNQAITKSPTSVDANYSMGALYYNKAAFLTQEMNALPEDYSSAGLKKLEAMKKEVMSYFDQALPYFQKAESLNANDLNTLIALTEIYARKEDDLSLEFKKRMTTVKDGGQNATSYFKQ